MKIIIYILFLFGSLLYTSAQELTLENQINIAFNKDYWISVENYHSGLAIDTDGNKIVVGSFTGKDVLFDSNNKLSTNKNTNAFIAKYNNNNEIIWIKNIGGNVHQLEGTYNSSDDYASDVLTDKDNNIYLLMSLDVGAKDTIDLDPQHPGTNSGISSNIYDPWIGLLNNKNIILVKYSVDGEYIWSREIGDDFNDNSLQLAFDSDNNIIVTGTITGYTGNIIDFDTTKYYTNGEDLIEGEAFYLGFIVRYTKDGEFINVKGFGEGILSKIFVKAAPSGNFYVAGAFNNSTEDTTQGLSIFKEDPTPHRIRSKGFHEFGAGMNEDIFVMKYNSSGEVQWVKTINSVAFNRPDAIVLDNNENIYISGHFKGNNVDFDIDTNLTYDKKSSATNGSAFIAKYEPDNGMLIWLKTVEGGSHSRANALCINNNYLTVGGDFNGNVSMGSIDLSSAKINPFVAILDTDGNWVSSLKIDKTQNSSITKLAVTPNGTLHFLGRGVRTDPNATNTSIGIFAIDVENIFFGELRNTLLPTEPIYTTLTQTVCDYYISPGGKVFNTTGIYNDTIVSTEKDTIYTIDLTVYSLNTQININGNVLSAVEQNASYRWLNCDTGTLITNATDKDFTATENGDYAVILDNSICTDTSGCISITLTGVEKNSVSDEIEIFPNPTSDILYVNSLFEIKQIKIFDLSGNLVLHQTKNKQVDIKNLAKGMYFAEIITESEQVKTKRFLKQ